jgi:hypothetical protein
MQYQDRFAQVSDDELLRRLSSLLEMLADGRLHLSGIAMLRPHLTSENAAALLERAAHRTKSQIEELLAELAPRPDVPAVIRRLPVASAPAPAATPSLLLSEGQHRPDGVASTVTSAAVVQPLAPERLDEAALLSGWGSRHSKAWNASG